MLKSSASTVTKVTLPGGASISLLTLLNELLLNPHLAFHPDETHSDTRLNILNRLGVVTKFRAAAIGPRITVYYNFCCFVTYLPVCLHSNFNLLPGDPQRSLNYLKFSFNTTLYT